MEEREIIRRDGLAALPGAWIAFWLATAIGQIGSALVSIKAGC